MFPEGVRNASCPLRGGLLQGWESVCWGVVGIPLIENRKVSWFLGFLGYWFLSFLASWFLGFLVSWFLGLWVTWFLSFLVSWFLASLFQRFLVSWLLGFFALKIHLMLCWKILIPYYQLAISFFWQILIPYSRCWRIYQTDRRDVSVPAFSKFAISSISDVLRFPKIIFSENDLRLFLELFAVSWCLQR